MHIFKGPIQPTQKKPLQQSLKKIVEGKGLYLI